ncbi:hypothetical protein VK98_13610 [Chromobacterium sp. LK11]|nr:hypothetical protein VK98_13610 [Chromobacterium sp. LK11]
MLLFNQWLDHFISSGHEAGTILAISGTGAEAQACPRLGAMRADGAPRACSRSSEQERGKAKQRKKRNVQWLSEHSDAVDNALVQAAMAQQIERRFLRGANNSQFHV